MITLILLVIIFSMISSLLLGMNILISSYTFSQREKKSPFECGFEIFQSMRLPFSIHFFFIAILFLIFDIEIIFFYSMILSNNMLNYKSWFFCSLFILMILLIGLEYEKMEGPLKWMI